ncbi:hypothetical protein ZWY2020_013553 [Hordeum vulgare]|nr:hypothetical protein ZWY2020_013553 [Hordeum vulgare]
MLIACKYEEIWAAEVGDFISIADNYYSRQQILSMEKNILNSMAWNLTVPTPYVPGAVRQGRRGRQGASKHDILLRRDGAHGI